MDFLQCQTFFQLIENTYGIDRNALEDLRRSMFGPVEPVPDVFVPIENELVISDDEEEEEVSAEPVEVESVIVEPEPDIESVVPEVEARCRFVPTRGKNKGITCGKKAKENHLCTAHCRQVRKRDPPSDNDVPVVQPVQPEPEEARCMFVPTCGKNKGITCGKKAKENCLCAAHRRLRQPVQH